MAHTIDATIYPAYFAAHSLLVTTQRRQDYFLYQVNMDDTKVRYAGPTPFESDFSHRTKPNMQDQYGTLGIYDFSIHPQDYIPQQTTLHRLFMAPSSFERFDWRRYAVRRTRDTFVVGPDYMRLLIKAFRDIIWVHQLCCELFDALKFSIVSPVDLEMLFGDDWHQLMALVKQPLPLWEIERCLIEMRRCIMEGAAWVELHARVLVWNVAYITGNTLPRWPVRADLMGGILCTTAKAGVYDLAREFGELGLPVHIAELRGEPHGIDSDPPGETSRSLAWQQAVDEVRRNTCGNFNFAAHAAAIRERHREILSIMVDAKLALPPKVKYTSQGTDRLDIMQDVIPDAEYTAHPRRGSTTMPLSAQIIHAAYDTIGFSYVNEYGRTTSLHTRTTVGVKVIAPKISRDDEPKVFRHLLDGLSHLLNSAILPKRQREFFVLPIPRWNAPNTDDFAGRCLWTPEPGVSYAKPVSIMAPIQRASHSANNAPHTALSDADQTLLESIFQRLLRKTHHAERRPPVALPPHAPTAPPPPSAPINAVPYFAPANSFSPAPEPTFELSMDFDMSFRSSSPAPHPIGSSTSLLPNTLLPTPPQISPLAPSTDRPGKPFRDSDIDGRPANPYDSDSDDGAFASTSPNTSASAPQLPWQYDADRDILEYWPESYAGPFSFQFGPMPRSSVYGEIAVLLANELDGQIFSGIAQWIIYCRFRDAAHFAVQKVGSNKHPLWALTLQYSARKHAQQMLRGMSRAKSLAFEILPSVSIVPPREAASLPWQQWDRQVVQQFQYEQDSRRNMRVNMLRTISEPPHVFASRLRLPNTFSSELLFGAGNAEATVQQLERRWQRLGGSNEPMRELCPRPLKGGVVHARDEAPYALLSRYFVPVTVLLRYASRYRQALRQGVARGTGEREFDGFLCQLHLHLQCTSKQKDKEFRQPLPTNGIFRQFFALVVSEERERLPYPYRLETWHVQVMETFGWSLARQMYEVVMFDNGMGHGLYRPPQ